MFKKPRGTEDIYGENFEKYKFLKDTMENIGERYGFTGIVTPVFEHSDLYIRTIGEETDVVQKEMYIFNDKSDREMALRPEGTAGIIRAYIENGIFNEGSPTKLMYFLPMYRYENVQKGRQREFNQFGIELLQSPNAIADYEVINVALTILRELGIAKEDYILKINSIGCDICRTEYKLKLKEYIEENIKLYCPDCIRRKDTNILRVLDCKIESCQKLNENAPSILDYLCDDCKDHFDQLIIYFEDEELDYEIDNRIVRGLDYYNRTVFEIQDKDGIAILAGGRYDKLAEQLDGKETPAVGFAAGIERIMTMIEIPENMKKRVDFYIISDISDENKRITNLLAQNLRRKGHIVEIDVLNRSFNAQMKHANKLKSKIAIIMGEDEIINQEIIIKNMDSGEETKVRLEDFLNTL